MSTMDCELCVVGAGIAGLNALHSASRYLNPTDRVVLVDERPAPGGMWRDAYEFVRLHQPHPVFTVGDIPWRRKMDPAHLASKEEVNEQLSHSLHILGKRIDMKSLFGYRYVNHREIEDGNGSCVEIDLHAQSTNVPQRVRARRLIKATGYNVVSKDPLPLSSTRVHSVSPDQPEFVGNQIESSQAPIFIAGGGKTAMDTARNLLERCPDRDLYMLVGDGVAFLDRNKVFRRGWARWFGGVLPFEVFLDMALHFDGANVENNNEYRMRKYGLSLVEKPAQFQGGLLSPQELSYIRNGLREVIPERFEDIVDTPAGPEMRLGSGKTLAVPEGSWIINCTGYVARQDEAYEPYISRTGNVLAVNQTSMPFYLTSFNGYFLPHLMYRGEILEVPLYAMDMTELVEKRKAAVGSIWEATTVLNTLLLMKTLPGKVFSDCLIDLNRMYPLPRKLPVLLRYAMNNERYARHCRQVLDRFARDHGVNIGVLPHVSA